jgi:hypothetical protein
VRDKPHGRLKRSPTAHRGKAHGRGAEERPRQRPRRGRARKRGGEAGEPTFQNSSARLPHKIRGRVMATEVLCEAQVPRLPRKGAYLHATTDVLVNAMQDVPGKCNRQAKCGSNSMTCNATRAPQAPGGRSSRCTIAQRGTRQRLRKNLEGTRGSSAISSPGWGRVPRGVQAEMA